MIAALYWFSGCALMLFGMPILGGLAMATGAAWAVAGMIDSDDDDLDAE